MLSWNESTSGLGKQSPRGKQTETTDQTDSGIDRVSNHEFMASLFGESFDSAKPLVCSKPGDPAAGGWMPREWPCPTSDSGLNWYFGPGLYEPDSNGHPRAKREHVQAVHVICLDDVGTKADMQLLDALAPTWLIETSPGNYQAGYAFDQPVEDRDYVDQLKQKLIENGLCDPGATGGVARWMRLPVGINGKPQFGSDGVRCRLVQWEPNNRYSPGEIEDAFLSPPAQASGEQLSIAIDGLNPVISALKTNGQYIRPNGGRRHEIVCPWWEQHSDPSDTRSYYYEPSEKSPHGGFKCFHSHGSGLRIRDLLGHLNIAAKDVSIKPTVVVQPGHIVRVVTDAELALANMGGIYHSHNMLCTVRQDVSTGDVQVKPLNKDRLLLDASNAAIWERHKQNGDVNVIDPPEKYIGILLEKGDYQHIPQLLGIARQPYFYGNFVLSSVEEYDPESRMFGAFRANDYFVPQTPTLDQAQKALDELIALLIEFKFQSPRDRDAALAGILTAVLRSSLPTSPMFHVRAPQIASGKSYLCNLIAAFAGPGAPAVSAFPETQEECQKYLLSALLDAPAVVIFDNLTKDLLPYTSLCSALTEESIRGRILGLSKTAWVSTKTLFLSSGNNVGPVRDMTRRTIVIALDPQTELASARDFKLDPLSMLRKNRSHYVSLVLTIVNAWLAAGQPLNSCRKLASYERWSEMVRQPLLWLGVSDPAAGLYSAQENDPEKQMLLRLLLAWKQCFGSVPTMVREAVSYAGSCAANSGDLKEVLEEVAERRGEINRRTLGHMIARYEGRVVGGMRFERSFTKANAERWSVRTLSTEQSDVSDVSVSSSQGKTDHLEDDF
jgi:hypothetical protein